MQCFGNLWVDVLLGLIALCHILPLFIQWDVLQQVILAVNLLCHGALVAVMLVCQFSLEELLVLVLASGLFTLALGYFKEKGAKR